MPDCQVSRSLGVSWEHPVLAKRQISVQPGKRMETARKDADSEISLPPHEVPPAAAAAAPAGAGAGAACPVPAKSG